MKIIHLSDHY